MANRSERLTELTSAQLANLQAEADEMADMQDLLNKLPMGLQVEDLTNEECERLRQITRRPITELCGDRFLSWHNMCRPFQGYIKDS